MGGKSRRPAIEVEGGAQLRRAFARFDERLSDLREMYRGIGELVAGEARDLVPRLSGRLADTIRPSQRKTGASVYVGGARAVYAPPIHFGWRKRNIEPQPFLYDAIDDRRGEILARYNDTVDGLVRRFDVEAPD